MSLAIALRKAFDQGLGTLAAGSHVAQLRSGGRSVTGQPVSADSAITFAAYFAVVRILSESLAQLPLITYRRLPKGKERATDHPLYPVLHDRANPQLTAFSWRESSMAHVVSWGDTFSAIARDGRGIVRELWPLAPDRMLDVYRTPDPEGALRYRYQALDGRVRELTSQEVFHVPGLLWNGLKGSSLVGAARDSIAIGRAITEHTGRFFEHDARPGVVYSHPKTLNDKARENLRKTLGEAHQGVGAAWNFALLEEGMTVQAIPAEDAHFIEAGKLVRNELAMISRIPPHMMGDLDRATFSNIEHQSLEFVTYCLGPWLVRWEQALGMQLLGPDWVGAGGDYFVEFLVDGLLRGDIATRYGAYHTARLDGWLSADEIRERENLNPLPNGEGAGYWRPLNITSTAPDGTITTTVLADTTGRTNGGQP